MTGACLVFRPSGRSLIAAVFGALAALSCGVFPASAETSRPTVPQATAFIQALADDAITVLNDTGGSDERRQREFGRLLDSSFEMQTIGRFAMGRHWNTCTASQQDEYQDLFRAFVIHKYATLLGGYSGQKFVVLRAIEAGDKDVMVSTEMSASGQDPMRADWRVRNYNGRPKVIDIKVEGISMLTSQRDEFGAVIQKSGIEGLLELLRQQSTTDAAAAGGLRHAKNGAS